MKLFSKVSSKTLVFTSVLVSVGLLFSCGGEKGKNSAENSTTVEENSSAVIDGGEFVYGVATELNNFDPFQSITADVRGVNFNIFEGLFF